VAVVVGFLVGGVLYSAVNGVYESYGELPYAKPIDSLPSYFAQMLVGGAVINVLLAVIYAVIHQALPGHRAWQKGLVFGGILLVLYMLPIAFNAWMQIAQPPALILVEAVNRAIGLMIEAVVIAVIYGQERSQAALA
jgi:hypothetical protein